KKKAIREEIHNHFQTNDKEKIREIIFANPAAKEVLESILHPLVHKEIEKLIQKHRKQKTPILFFVIPLLFETHMENLFDTTVAIVSSQKNQEARLIKRDNISLEQAQKIIYSQIPNARKAELANYTLTNNGTQKALQQKVSTLLKKIQS
ncbi:MAG: dephospho-CoA kinase, partial [Bdellovibrionota bacterium]